MLDRYGKESPVLFDLRDWYLEECEKYGQSLLGKRPSKWATFDNGITITKEQRQLYRSRTDLQNAFPDPYATETISGSYCHWFAANGAKAISKQNQPEPNIIKMLRRHSHRPPVKWAKNHWKSARAAI